MAVNMTKREGRHSSVELARHSFHRPRHLCSAFDLATGHRESRCDIQNCDCTVRLSTGSWARGDATFVVMVDAGWNTITA